MAKFLTGISLIACGWVISAWLLMLLVDLVHDEWLPILPTIGYATALLVTVLLGARKLIGLLIGYLVRDLAEEKP